MVIHTVIDEYDLLYAQEREMQFVMRSPDPAPTFSSALTTEQTSLANFHDNSFERSAYPFGVWRLCQF